MFKKIAAGASALALATALVSCTSEEALDEVDVNGLTVSEACEKVREAGWIVDEVMGTEDRSEMSDCSDGERNVVRSMFWNGSATLYFPNEPKDAETAIEEAAAEDALVEDAPVEDTPVEDTPVEDTPVEDAPAIDSTSGYQEIYDEYSARIQAECPALSIAECAELSNEGVLEMASYMYRATGTDGQYATYETWSHKLYDVYMDAVI